MYILIGVAALALLACCAFYARQLVPKPVYLMSADDQFAGVGVMMQDFSTMMSETATHGVHFVRRETIKAVFCAGSKIPSSCEVNGAVMATAGTAIDLTVRVTDAGAECSSPPDAREFEIRAGPTSVLAAQYTVDAVAASEKERVFVFASSRFLPGDFPNPDAECFLELWLARNVEHGGPLKNVVVSLQLPDTDGPAATLVPLPVPAPGGAEASLSGAVLEWRVPALSTTLLLRARIAGLKGNGQSAPAIVLRASAPGCLVSKGIDVSAEGAAVAEVRSECAIVYRFGGLPDADGSSPAVRSTGPGSAADTDLLGGLLDLDGAQAGGVEGGGWGREWGEV